MKRCPQCEFIYEDDQSLCDMDGVLLVFDSKTLPSSYALATVPERAQQRRNRAVPAFATLVLALVLGMVYFVSTRRTPVPTTEPPVTATSPANPAPVADPTPEAQPSESPKEEPKSSTEEPKPPNTKQPAVAPAKKPAAAKAAPVPETRTTTAPKKEESKVGSILKKTGRILKKPFKF